MSFVLPHPKSTALVVIDVQERLAAAMPEAQLRGLVKAHVALLEMAALFQLPVSYTEQYPKGLGPTVQPLRELLLAAERVEKVEFSACRVPSFRDVILSRLPADVILTGMETHVCVLQTAVDLIEAGRRVFVPADAVASRTDSNRLNGLALMERAGAVVANSETLIFNQVGSASSHAFKRLSALIK